MADIAGDCPPSKRQKLQSPALTPSGSEPGMSLLQLVQYELLSLKMHLKYEGTLVMPLKKLFVFILDPGKDPASVWFQP